MLLLSSCQFNEENELKEQPKIEKEYTPQNYLKTISKEGIYLINKNWNKKQLDSILIANNEISILENNFDLLFITDTYDSIIINTSKISRKNPIIIYHKTDGPLLTSLERLNLYLEKKGAIKEKPKQEYKTRTNIPKSKKPKPTQIRREPDNLDSLFIIPNVKLKKFKIDFSREISKKPVSIISQFYPIIPNITNLEIYFDNDFWDYTDYYYTNGLRLGFTHQVFSNSPLSYLLVSNAKNGLDYYGIQIVQQMYTGSQPKVDTTVPGDRPWAAFMMIGQYATSFDWAHKIKHESEINFGILGPKSGGGFLQDLVHNILPNNSPPAGWYNQIKTDIILDYQYRIYKSLYETRLFESYIKASVQGGSLQDNLKWGLGAKYGVFIPFYRDFQNQVYQESNRKLYYSIFGDIETQLIGYDALLQGGVSNRSSVYVIPTKNVERFVIQGYLGFEFTYRRIQLQFIQYWKSKEFKTGKDHKYVSVRLYIGF